MLEAIQSKKRIWRSVNNPSETYCFACIDSVCVACTAPALHMTLACAQTFECALVAAKPAVKACGHPQHVLPLRLRSAGS